MELIGNRPFPGVFDRTACLAGVESLRNRNRQQAQQQLEKAMEYRDQGEQGKANWAFNSVANQYALDATSNEDARVQLENSQTQAAVIGLNSRRQRLYLDNPESAPAANSQLQQGAANNPILRDGVVTFRPQDMGQLLQGNTTEDNAVLERITGRLVRHQKATAPAPQAISIVEPMEGVLYQFRRSVQVSKSKPLELQLEFGSSSNVGIGRTALAILILSALVGAITFITQKRRNQA